MSRKLTQEEINWNTAKRDAIRKIEEKLQENEDIDDRQLKRFIGKVADSEAFFWQVDKDALQLFLMDEYFERAQT